MDRYVLTILEAYNSLEPMVLATNGTILEEILDDAICGLNYITSEIPSPYSESEYQCIRQRIRLYERLKMLASNYYNPHLEIRIQRESDIEERQRDA